MARAKSYGYMATDCPGHMAGQLLPCMGAGEGSRLANSKGEVTWPGGDSLEGFRCENRAERIDC